MRELFARLFDWMRRDRLERELAEELRFHREHLEREALNAGTPRSEAVYAARRQLGNTTSITENARDRWSLPALELLLQDARYSLRALKRAPGFTATVVLTLALGIGANAAMFGVVDQLIYRPFAYLRDPETAHRVYLRVSPRGVDTYLAMTEYTRYLDLLRWTSSFSHVAAFAEQPMALGVGDEAREHLVAPVSASFFDFFNAPPALGRYFAAGEDTTPRGAEVAVLSHEYWMSAFAGRDVRGERLQVGHIPTTIIGVTPRGFTGARIGEAPAVYLPATTYAGSFANPEAARAYYTNYSITWISVMVRRKPGVTIEQASADATEAIRRSWMRDAEIDPGTMPLDVAKPRAVIGALKEGAGPRPALEARTAVWVAAVAVIVLLIACANVANLFLARGLRRSREIAVRLALGASRGRLATQLLMEALLLSVAGGVAGLAIAQWGGGVIRGLLMQPGDRGRDLALFNDGRTLGLVAVMAALVAALTALAPALFAGRSALAPALKAGAREGTHRRSRTRTGLLVLQGALSVALLVGAALFVRSLEHVKDIRLGFEPERVLVVSRNLRGTNLDSVQRAVLRRTLIAAAQAAPGVDAAAWGNMVPFQNYGSMTLFVAGIDSTRRLGRFIYQTTTPQYFRAMGTRLLRGRGLEDNDRDGSALVAVVSEGMAKVLWPDADAIGQCFRMQERTAPCTTVVGIAEDIVLQPEQFASTKRFQYYVPVEQHSGGGFLFVRTTRDPRAEMEPLRKTLQAVMPGQSYVTVRALDTGVQNARRSWRLGATLFVAFGALALVVAAIGLYAVIAYNVTQRMHEMGVRVALGARRSDILRLVLGQSTAFALAGVASGSALALFAGRWLQPLLFEQSARDPMIYVGVGTAMILVALVASASPALRATRADPNAALRSE